MRHEIVDDGGNVQSISVEHEGLDVAFRQKLENSAPNKNCKKNEAENFCPCLHCAEVRGLDVKSEFGDVTVDELVFLTFRAQLACVLGGVP